MINIYNPYNVLTFSTVNTDRLKGCPLMSPSKLLPFQIKVSDTDANFSLQAVNEEGALFSISTSFVDETVNDQRVLSYIPTVDILLGGVYQLRFSSDELDLYSHWICVENRYNQQRLDFQCVGGANFEMTFIVKGCDYASISANVSGLEYLAQDSIKLTAADIGPSFTDVTIPIRVVYVTDDETTAIQYELTYQVSDPCGTAQLTQTDVLSQTAASRFCYIEFWHSDNHEEKFLEYENSGYKQRFYFEVNEDFSTPVINEEFQELYDGSLDFDYATEADQLNIDFFPLPEHVVSYLGQARFHDNVFFVDAQTGESKKIESFSLSPVRATNLDCQGGRMTFEINRVFTNHC